MPKLVYVCCGKSRALHKVRVDQCDPLNPKSTHNTAAIDELMADLFMGEIPSNNNDSPDLWLADVQVNNIAKH